MKRINFLKALPFVLIAPIKILGNDEAPIWRWHKKSWNRIQWNDIKKGYTLKIYSYDQKKYVVFKSTSDCYINENGIKTVKSTGETL